MVVVLRYSIRPTMSSLLPKTAFIVLATVLTSFAQVTSVERVDAISDHIRHLYHSLNVMHVSLAPSYEDFVAMSFLRSSKGANTLSVYVTNGESGENDLFGDTPLSLAERRRQEAARAVARLGAEPYFLNLPDPGVFRDTLSLDEYWILDTLTARFSRVITSFKPDIVFLSGGGREKSTRFWNVVKERLQSTIERKAQEGLSATGSVSPGAYWQVDRLIADVGPSGGKALVTRNVSTMNKQVVDLARKAFTEYESLYAHAREFPDVTAKRYEVLFSFRTRMPKTIDVGLFHRIPRQIRPLHEDIRAFGSDLQNNLRRTLNSRKETESTLKRLADVVHSVDSSLAFSPQHSTEGRRYLLQWKDRLESIKVQLLGIKFFHTLRDSVLTNLQVTYFSIDSLVGSISDGTTEVLFAPPGNGWVINESMARRVPFKVGEEFRILSPQHLEYDLPFAQHGHTKSTLGQRFLVFIIHRSVATEKNFFYRIPLTFHFAPRFIVEPLTPIVRIMDDEKIVVRLTNHSRDGVRDSVRVQSEIVTSEPKEFRVNTKGASHVDTLTLSLLQKVDEGSYLLPIQIHSQTVSHFVGRSFDVAFDSSKRVGYLQGVTNSPLVNALLRLGVQAQPLVLDETLRSKLDNLNVVVLDRRAMTFRKELERYKQTVDSFVDSGGHVIVFAQDPYSWNVSRWIESVSLVEGGMSPASAVGADSSHPFFRLPNVLNAEVWDEWLYFRSYNTVNLSPQQSVTISAWSEEKGSPLILTEHRGNGRITYVSLALEHQLLNIHPGAFRLLANLLSN
jgi:hypothetical protein